VAFFPLSGGSVFTDLPEVIVPLGISLGIALYSVRLLQSDYDVDRIKRIAVYGWTGALVAAVGLWGLSQELHRQLSVTPLLDEALTFLSVGSGAGVLLGAHIVDESRSVNQPDRDRVLAEAVWTNEAQPNPILVAVTAQIAELEGVHPLELPPLYEHIDPDTFVRLQAQDGSEWQLLFYTDDYEIRVSGQGTVTIYDAVSTTEPVDRTCEPRGQW
jgi:hypothetical protein